MSDLISRLNEIRRLSGYRDEDMRKGGQMSDSMTFPDTVEEFMEQYKVVDTEQIYTNGTEFVPIFRMRQWFQHEQQHKRWRDRMGCDLYKVSTLNIDVARHMPLETALILVKALMVKYYSDPDLPYTIQRERKDDAHENKTED